MTDKGAGRLPGAANGAGTGPGGSEGTGTGHGLAGMAERAAAVGGGRQDAD